MKDNLRSENEKYEIMRLSSVKSKTNAEYLMQNINDLECLYEMIQPKEKSKAAENHKRISSCI